LPGNASISPGILGLSVGERADPDPFTPATHGEAFSNWRPFSEDVVTPLRQLQSLAGDEEMNARIVIISVLLVTPGDPARGEGNEELLKKRFLSEYPAAMEAWERRFSRAQGVVRLTEHRTSTYHDTRKEDLSRSRVHTYSFKYKLPDMASVVEALEKEGKVWVQHVRGYNKEYSFSLRKKEDAKEFSVQSLEAKGPDYPSIPIALRTYLFSPYSAHVPLKSIISRPSFSVQSVSPVSRDGKSLLKIVFDCPIDPPKNARKGSLPTGGLEGTLLLSPEEKWVLYEYECRVKKGVARTYKGTVDYQLTSVGFPIPKRVTHHSSLNHPDVDRVDTLTYECQEFRFADEPDESFTLAAFGISEDVVRPSTRASGSWLGYCLLGVALAALALAVCFKIASSRLLKRASQPSSAPHA
jgi:hypothetical protein